MTEHRTNYLHIASTSPLHTHVWPDEDATDHEMHGADCVCGPNIVPAGKVCLVVHASLDGRELTERVA